MKPNKYTFKKEIFFLLIIIFTASSCSYEEASFKRVSKKEMMESWAWKIFIFTDEGDNITIKSNENNFNGIVIDKLIFAEGDMKMSLNDVLFLKKHEVAIREANTTLLSESK